MTQKYSVTTWMDYSNDLQNSAWLTIADDITHAEAAARFIQLHWPHLEDNCSVDVAVFNHDTPKNVAKITVTKKVTYETKCYRGEEANRDEPDDRERVVKSFNRVVEAFVDAVAGGER